MASVQAHGIVIEYDRIGDPVAPAMLLIMGFTAQLIQWEEEFCRMLASHGYQVIRFDNRDAGLSSKIEDGSYYTLEDMADDGFGLLDA
ncbi:MAG TPA: alpha/beta hydrolase, partial [Ktedonobacteraceae bacterium]|nr:alpha/beta hydrolase [Ktedonobacteraceae bacterium]